MFCAGEVKHHLDLHTGRENGVTAEGLVREITGAPSTTAAMRMLRKRIEELRLAGVPVCGLPATGYFLSGDEKDINDTCEFLHRRAMTSLTQISRMKKVADINLRTQLGLPMEEKCQQT